MEHTKGKADYHTYSGGFRELVVNGSTIASISGNLCAEANAQRLATCWNEHDTLKAKEALFDELIDWIEAEDTTEYVPNKTTRELVNLVINLRNKAKEL